MVISISFFMYDLHLYLMMMVTCLAGKKVSKAPKIQRLVTPHRPEEACQSRREEEEDCQEAG
jgi:hypothetical protein